MNAFRAHHSQSLSVALSQSSQKSQTSSQDSDFAEEIYHVAENYRPSVLTAGGRRPKMKQRDLIRLAEYTKSLPSEGCLGDKNVRNF